MDDDDELDNNDDKDDWDDYYYMRRMQEEGDTYNFDFLAFFVICITSIFIFMVFMITVGSKFGF